MRTKPKDVAPDLSEVDVNARLVESEATAKLQEFLTGTVHRTFLVAGDMLDLAAIASMLSGHPAGGILDRFLAGVAGQTVISSTVALDVALDVLIALEQPVAV